MNGSAGVIYFHIKGRGLRNFVFLLMTFGMCITNLYFENGEVEVGRSWYKLR